MAGSSLDAPSLGGWYLGFALAGVAITVVVVLVAIILTMAQRIAVQAEAITEALDSSRVNTLPLWDVQVVNGAAAGIHANAGALRELLEQRL